MYSNNLNSNHKNLIKLNFLFFSIFLFFLYFFSNTFIYAQHNEKSDTKYLIPVGNVIQIDAELKNLLVRNTTEDSPFNIGDMIISINNKNISNYGEFSNCLSSLSNDNVDVLICRSSTNITIHTNKEELEKINFNNLLSGFATLTYIDPDVNEFGAVAHPISVGTTRKIPIKFGAISSTSNLNFQRSIKGCVGCINGQRLSSIGEFTYNSDFGIKGKITNFNTQNLKKYKVASLDEVKLGKAELLLKTDADEPKKYDIQIINVYNQRSPQAKTIKFRITDKELLAKTGGVVQGMSGTPIIQNNKIIGAVSHAIENDPSFGYGVFIKWMME